MNEDLSKLGIEATQDYPWFGLKKYQAIPISERDGLIVSGSLSWSPEKLTQEINDGYWNLVIVTSGDRPSTP